MFVGLPLADTYHEQPIKERVKKEHCTRDSYASECNPNQLIGKLNCDKESSRL